MVRRRRVAIAPARGIALVCVLGLAPVIACGLDAVGTDAISDASPNAAIDGATPPSDEGDGAVTRQPGLADGDVPEATTIPFDAGEVDVDAGCNTVAIDDPLSSISASRWLVTSSGNPGLPAPVSTNVGDIVKLVTTRDGSRGALWLTNPVPLQAFDVQFTVFGDCGSYDIFDPSCADGFVAAWLDTSGAGDLGAALDNAGTGSSFGIPSGLSGGGVAIDLHQNGFPISDPYTPSLEALAIDGSMAPATYDWSKSTAQHTRLAGYTHTIGLRLRGTALTVSYDGQPAYGGAPVTVPATPSGTFGFTAATGGENAVFYVWDFHAVFYDCLP
jgi:hypothetical protein